MLGSPVRAPGQDSHLRSQQHAWITQPARFARGPGLRPLTAAAASAAWPGMSGPGPESEAGRRAASCPQRAHFISAHPREPRTSTQRRSVPARSRAMASCATRSAAPVVTDTRTRGWLRMSSRAGPRQRNLKGAGASGEERLEAVRDQAPLRSRSDQRQPGSRRVDAEDDGGGVAPRWPCVRFATWTLRRRRVAAPPKLLGSMRERRRQGGGRELAGAASGALACVAHHAHAASDQQRAVVSLHRLADLEAALAQVGQRLGLGVGRRLIAQARASQSAAESQRDGGDLGTSRRPRSCAAPDRRRPPARERSTLRRRRARRGRRAGSASGMAPPSGK